MGKECAPQKTSNAPPQVYVDANPTTPAVLKDLNDWWPMLLPGGIMGGSRFEHEGVQAAVRQFAGERGLDKIMLSMDGSWFLIKDEKRG